MKKYPELLIGGKRVHIILTVVLMAGGKGPGDMGGTLLFFAAIFAIMYFLIIRPQAKKQKEQRLMMESLEKGDRVITAGGILGTIAGIKEKENILILKVAENVKIEILRSSIVRKLPE